VDTDTIRTKYEALAPVLTERSRRLWAATEAKSLGHGGIAAVIRATGISRSTISRGIQELALGEASEPQRVRRRGAGRKRTADKDPTLQSDLSALLEATTAGMPNAPLRWTSKSTRKLAAELQAMGHTVSATLVAELLVQQGYTLQANRKTREGGQHPDRDAQFHYLNEQIQSAQQRGEPVISVDTKKKELIGDFKNPGREWRPKGTPERVRVHDFVIPGQGKAIPYGVYDLSRNEGWVSVGIDHDTADGGGSNGSRTRLWKWELQQFANRTGLTITVCHYPPGTSKWNKIEHRLFSHIAMNWRGKALTSLATIVSLIGSTTTNTGLRVRSEIDKRSYPKGVSISDGQMEQLHLQRHEFHADWNYTIRPRKANTN
jgi:hypothetical protein